MTTEAEMIKEELNKRNAATEPPIRKLALNTAARLLLSDHATEADVTRALALIKLAREMGHSDAVDAAEAAAYNAGATEMRERIAQVIYDLYRNPGGFGVSHGDIKNLAEAIGEMAVVQ